MKGQACDSRFRFLQSHLFLHNIGDSNYSKCIELTVSAKIGMVAVAMQD